ncbi:glycine/betaine ABC transporter permease [Leminorella grimontii]|uniref:Glycine/betaine ABC transporter permease n=1 Tax=Leminorella grimontii TaxID=82981 RepID=A0AAV5N2J2_9GAMM|nr:ABC transporter permease [Leminorella grimontii]KFC96152.1 permease component of an ABC superfamily glycine betaine/carnitine/choline transporter [Leminorella grimontii ATCC 33999 = DSM 5078]GKX54662.1 glycine/betaine ABC transporter permease [Leminorella grimontii]VFS58721.1 Putative osmoprotectant uptake system permease protein yehW [Leminorella grimontii]
MHNNWHKSALIKRLILGGLLFIVVIAFIAYGIGIDALKQHKEDLFYLGHQHLYLVACSMLLALVVGLPSGVLLSRRFARRWAEPAMQIFNVGNTLPPLAVLALAMVVVGIGDKPAIFALFLASLLPIVRNTYSGLKAIPPSLIEAADSIGMTPLQRLMKVELPNALPVIMTGVRIAAAINVGTVPLTFLIGASSYGELIFPGIYLNDATLLFLGATATAVVALLLDTALAALSYLLSPQLAR